MTAAPVLPVALGLVGSTPIVAQSNSATLASRVAVTLSADYVRSAPPGYPNPNAGVASSSSLTASPQTISSGTTMKLFSCEAAALVAAGAATY